MPQTYSVSDHFVNKDPAIGAMNNSQDIPSLIISMECTALDRWIRGDPSGFLEICAPDVVYFDPYGENR